MKTSLILISGLICTTAYADTLYKCTDKQSDTVLYTNQRVGGRHCVVISNTPSAAPPARAKAAATPTPGDFPRVSTSVQKQRDNDRRTILEQELANEQRNLDEARKANNVNKAQLHERNIAALQKEIGHLK